VALPLNGAHLNSRLLDSAPTTLLGRVLKATHPEVESELRKTDPAAIHAQSPPSCNKPRLQRGPGRAAPMPLLLVYGEAPTPWYSSPNSHVAGEPVAIRSEQRCRHPRRQPFSHA
jgi:hypothetical protein